MFVSGLQVFSPISKNCFSSCSDNHGLVAKPPTRNTSCPRTIRDRIYEVPSVRTESGSRFCLRLSLTASTVDRIEGSKNPETCALYAWRLWCQFLNRLNASPPCQRKPPGLDSTIGIIIPQGSKSDVLSCLIVREDPLYPFIELLGKCPQVLRGVELGTLPLLWLTVEGE